MQKRQQIQKPTEIADVILPRSLFTATKGATYVSDGRGNAPVGMKMQVWVLVAEASTIEAWLGATGVKPNWRDQGLRFRQRYMYCL